MTDPSTLHVPARELPVPSHLSPQAQATLARGLQTSDPYPALDDIEGWRRRIAATNEYFKPTVEWVDANIVVDVEEVTEGDVRIFVITPPNLDADTNRRIYLDIHGGALTLGAGGFCRAMGMLNAANLNARVWAVDYRMPPDHPYPTPLQDCLDVYRALLEIRTPREIVVGGVSAGGNLAAAMLLRARDEGLPLPAALVLLSPEVDLTESGDSFRSNLGVDTLLVEPLMPINLLYAAGHRLDDPYVSPLFGDFTRGFPPTFLATGTRDLFLSNTVRMHRALRAANIEAELHVFEAMPHGGFGGAPEDRELDREVRRFVDEYWGRSR